MWNEINAGEMKITQILKMTTKIFNANLKSILFATLIIFIPINLAVSIMPFDTISTNLANLMENADPNDYLSIINIAGSNEMTEYLKWGLSSALIQEIFGMIATMAVITISYNYIKGNTVDHKLALEEAFSKFFPAFITLILSWLMLLGFYLMLIIPALIVSVYITFMFYVIVIKNLKGFSALSYSIKLVKGHFWKSTFMIFFMWILRSSIVYMILCVFILLPVNTVTNFLSNCLSSVVSSFFWIFQTIWFLNYDSLLEKNTSIQK